MFRTFKTVRVYERGEEFIAEVWVDIMDKNDGEDSDGRRGQWYKTIENIEIESVKNNLGVYIEADFGLLDKIEEQAISDVLKGE